MHGSDRPRPEEAPEPGARADPPEPPPPHEVTGGRREEDDELAEAEGGWVPL